MQDGKKLIFTLNPGSTSLKIALYRESECIVVKNLQVKILDLIDDEKNYDQGFAGIMQIINDFFQEEKINIHDLDIVVARGGCTPPTKFGAYKINELMLNVLRYKPLANHGVIVGPAIAVAIARPLGIPAIIYDSDSADESDNFVHLTGLPEIRRLIASHSLNARMMCREFAQQLGKKYEELNIIVAHIGGGISIGAHEQGRIIDVAFVDDGPLGPTRTGALPARQMVELCYSGKYTMKEMLKFILQTGGLMAYLNTSDALEVEKMIQDGNEQAKEIYYTMAYQISKCIGQMSAALSGKIDYILLIGGISHSKMMTGWISERVKYLAPIHIIPGENEMKALAVGGLRVLNSQEIPQEYDIFPEGYASVGEFYQDYGLK